MLLDADADPDKPDDHGGALLHAAAYGQHAAIVDLLAARRRREPRAAQRIHAAALAAFLGDRAICAALLVAGARVNHAAATARPRRTARAGSATSSAVAALLVRRAPHDGPGFFRRLTAEQMAPRTATSASCAGCCSRADPHDAAAPPHARPRARARCWGATARTSSGGRRRRAHAAAPARDPASAAARRPTAARPADLVLQAARPWSAATHAVRAAAGARAPSSSC